MVSLNISLINFDTILIKTQAFIFHLQSFHFSFSNLEFLI